MAIHIAISPQEAADRLAIRELIDAYSAFADRREGEKQAALYSEDGRTLVYSTGADSGEPEQVLTGRSEHALAFRVLDGYEVTTQFNGQSTVVVDGDVATGESLCMAHHIFHEEGKRTLLTMAIRYEDSFIKEEGAWFFSERKLIVDWTDSRPSKR